MRTDLSSPLGFYSPSFFRIHVDTNESLHDLKALSPQTSAAFFHEYVHYLQDLITVYGLMNINYIVDFIKTVNFSQRASSQRMFEIPYVLTASKDGSVYYNSELQKLYSGTLKSINSKKINSAEIVQGEVSLPTPENHFVSKQVDRVKVKGIDANNVPFEYFFGSHSVLESMAYELEVFTHGKVLDAPSSLPYYGARQVADILFPGFADDPLNIIALCDWALMDFNPGKMYVQSLNFMFDNNYVPANAEDIFIYLKKHLTGTYQGFSHVDDFFTYMTISTASQLTSYFTSSVFGENKLWFDYLFSKAHILRGRFPNFFIKLAQGGLLTTNKFFSFIFSELGMPITTTNNNNAVYSIPNLAPQNIRPEMLWAINQIFKIYINSNKSQRNRCAMKEWCKESCVHFNIEDYTDERCDKAPWSRVHDSILCTFSQVWKTWGMENEIPTTLNPTLY